MILEVRAPTRIDLAGGTLDIFPLEIYASPALTVNIALKRCARARAKKISGRSVIINAKDIKKKLVYKDIRKIPPKTSLPLITELLRFYKIPFGLEIETFSEVPPGSGLGASSALGIAVHTLLRKLTSAPRVSADALIRTAQTLECALIGAPTGVQDYYPALYGGIQALWYCAGNVRREVLPSDKINFLEENLVLAYTGKSHLSSRTNWRVFRSAVEGRGKTRACLQRIGEASLMVREAVLAKNLKMLARGMNMEWEARRRLARGIETEKMRKIIESAKSAGALSAKACGAGGGGCVVFATPKNKKRAVESALSAIGADVIPVEIAKDGIKISRDKT